MTRTIALIAALSLMSVAPVEAKGGKTTGKPAKAKMTKGAKGTTSKRDGGIDPSNIAVIDDDFDAAAVGSTTLGWLGLEAVLTTDAQIGASVAHQVATGRDVVVAVLDAGFDLGHPAIAGNVSPLGYDALDLDFDPGDTGNGYDDDGDGLVDSAIGHGNFVCGMVLAAAPDAVLLPVRVRNDEGLGDNAAMVRGIEYAVYMGADVINLSLHEGQSRKAGIKESLKMAESMGVVVIGAAGNNGTDKLTWLASRTTVFAVGAVDVQDRIATFSNTGAALGVFAPGVDLYGPFENGRMGYWSGTSFATGIVSGAAALAIQLDPMLDAAGVREILRTAVDPVFDAGGVRYEGAGRINLALVVAR